MGNMNGCQECKFPDSAKICPLTSILPKAGSIQFTSIKLFSYDPLIIVLLLWLSLPSSLSMIPLKQGFYDALVFSICITHPAYYQPPWFGHSNGTKSNYELRCVLPSTKLFKVQRLSSELSPVPSITIFISQQESFTATYSNSSVVYVLNLYFGSILMCFTLMNASLQIAEKGRIM
jgi:hypothetical protein